MKIERFLVTPEADPQKVGRFGACLESSRELIIRNSRQPLVDGARELLARGFDPATLLKMRHQGSLHDSFRPAPISEWARWTYKEGERDSLRRTLWMPFRADRGAQKSGLELAAGHGSHPAEIRFCDQAGRPRWSAGAARSVEAS